MAFVPEIVENAGDFSDMPEDAQKAFRAYLVLANDRGQRSLLRVSETLSIPLGTVQTWASRFRWASRARSLDVTAGLELWEVTMLAAANSRPRIVQRLLEIMDGGKEGETVTIREQLLAIDQLRDIAGMSRLPPITSQPGSEGDDTGTHLTQSELDALAASGDVATLLALSRGQRPPS